MHSGVKVNGERYEGKEYTRQEDRTSRLRHSRLFVFNNPLNTKEVL